MVELDLKKAIIEGYVFLVLAFLLFLAASLLCGALDPTPLLCLSWTGLNLGLLCTEFIGRTLLVLYISLKI